MSNSNAKQTIHLINGPNLNLLGTREPSIYGMLTLKDIEKHCSELADRLGVELTTTQSNHEGDLIDAVHRAGKEKALGIVLNPGGYTHTSVALRDAIASVSVPTIEVHISNVHAREEFRHKSLTAGASTGVICGLGLEGYLAAIRYLANADK